MKTSIIPILALCTLLAACVTPASKDLVYRGEYFDNFEHHIFTPNGTEEDWCVDTYSLRKGTLPVMDEGAQAVSAQVVFRGKIGPEDDDGGRGLCYRVLAVTEILEVTNVRSHALPAAP
jgi:hypothetical protein